MHGYGASESGSGASAGALWDVVNLDVLEPIRSNDVNVNRIVVRTPRSWPTVAGGTGELRAQNGLAISN